MKEREGQPINLPRFAKNRASGCMPFAFVPHIPPLVPQVLRCGVLPTGAAPV